MIKVQSLFFFCSVEHGCILCHISVVLDFPVSITAQ